jgi:hypothetical protein
MTILLVAILLLQAVVLIALLWFWKLLNQKGDQLQILLTALRDQEAALGQTAERLTASTQKINQMAVDLHNIVAWTEQQRERQETEALSSEQDNEQTQLIVKALKEATEPSLRTIFLAKLFRNNARHLWFFEEFLEIARVQINEALAAGHFPLAFASLNSATSIIESNGPSLAFDDIKCLATKLDALRIEMRDAINQKLEEMLSSQQSITIDLLNVLDPREIDQSLVERLRERRKEMETKAQSEQVNEIASSIRKDIVEIDEKSSDAANKLQHIQVKLLRLTQSRDDLAIGLIPLLQDIEIKRTQVSKQQRMARLLSDKDRIEDAINTLSEFSQPILATGDRLVKADEAARLMTFVCSQYETITADGSPFQSPINIDTKVIANQIQNVETSKFNTYQMWALSKIESAFKQLKDIGRFQGDEEKKKSITRILTDALWQIDEQTLTNSVSSLYHAIEKELLDKLKEDSRIDVIK